MILTLTQSHVMRPRVVRIRAKKEEEKKDINPIKKFIMKVFKVQEIDYDKFILMTLISFQLNFIQLYPQFLTQQF